MYKYYVKEGSGVEEEVTMEEYVFAERRAGFFPKSSDTKRPCTSSFFTSSTILKLAGRIDGHESGTATHDIQ